MVTTNLQTGGVLGSYCNNFLKRYEMLCGIPPFYNENTDRMYELIKVGELKFPKKIKVSNEAQDLIAKVINNKISSSTGTQIQGLEVKQV
jgi:serine/threonine protein kinase